MSHTGIGGPAGIDHGHCHTNHGSGMIHHPDQSASWNMAIQAERTNFRGMTVNPVVVIVISLFVSGVLISLPYILDAIQGDSPPPKRESVEAVMQSLGTENSTSSGSIADLSARIAADPVLAPDSSTASDSALDRSLDSSFSPSADLSGDLSSRGLTEQAKSQSLLGPQSLSGLQPLPESSSSLSEPQSLRGAQSMSGSQPLSTALSREDMMRFGRPRNNRETAEYPHRQQALPMGTPNYEQNSGSGLYTREYSRFAESAGRHYAQHPFVGPGYAGSSAVGAADPQSARGSRNIPYYVLSDSPDGTTPVKRRLMVTR